MFKAYVWEKWITALKSLRIGSSRQKCRSSEKNSKAGEKKKEAYRKIILHNMKNCAMSAGSPLPEPSLPWNLLWRVVWGCFAIFFLANGNFTPTPIRTGCNLWDTDKGKFCEKYEQKNNWWCCLKKCEFNKCHEPIRLYNYFYTIDLYWWLEIVARDGLLCATIQHY